MAASPTTADLSNLPMQDKWLPGDDHVPDHLGAVGDGDHEPTNGLPPNGGESLPPPESADDFRSESSAVGKSMTFREKQVKPNKVYIGGLPEHTRQEDLRNCFGKIGSIVNIELKLGYGFVEFDNREAAEESVAKYHEGYFMGNKIRVELSHGGGRTAKYTGDPGACFKCGQMGHWARECPNHVATGRKSGHHGGHYQDPTRDYPPPPPRDYPPYRDDYGRYPPVRDARYGYEYPAPPPPRDYRRPATPPRDYRDYPSATRPPRDYDDYRMRGPASVPPPPRSYYPPDGPPGYPARSYDGPPRDMDRLPDRRTGPPPERYPPYPGRPRTPTGPPPSVVRPRDFEERAPPRDYPPSDFRGRPTTPPLPPPPGRYGEYPPRNGAAEPGTNRYRRRSQSPPPRSGGSANYRSAGYANERAPDVAPYPPGNAPYASPAGAYSGNGYTPGSSGPPSRAGGGTRDRNYPPRDAPEPSYSRRA